LATSNVFLSDVIAHTALMMTALVFRSTSGLLELHALPRPILSLARAEPLGSWGGAATERSQPSHRRLTSRETAPPVRPLFANARMDASEIILGYPDEFIEF
jgi:hypothetical protein